MTYTEGDGIDGEAIQRERAQRVKRARSEGLITKGAQSSRRKECKCRKKALPYPSWIERESVNLKVGSSSLPGSAFIVVLATLNRCVLCLVSLREFGLICGSTLSIVLSCKRQERSGAVVSVLGS